MSSPVSTCYHCGDDVIGKPYMYDDKEFCCNGCRSVYQLLTDNDLQKFYALDQKPGVKPVTANAHKYAFLDVPTIRTKYIDFEDENVVHLTLFLPQIHCSSCIYLLENIHKIEPRIQDCQVNFVKREATLIVKKELSLSELASILDGIGYAPNFGNKQVHTKKRNRSYLYKLGVAGFAFGSIMLWSFPEYLGIQDDNPEFRSFTSYLSLIVSIPVILYSANEYLISAYKAIKHKSLNLDVPISIGILALYAQSCYSILAGDGPGYMDSFAGFIFFLLIGKWFQSKTYDSLSFERDYKAYFPVAVTRKTAQSEEIVEIDQIQVDDIIYIRNMEIVPCDAILLEDTIKIDYSFVTGESLPVEKKQGDFVYAGGKLLGQKSAFKVQKESDRSHLTQLWNDRDTKENKTTQSADKLSIFFLVAVLIIALSAAIAWLIIDQSRLTEVVVSVLIVACPCALALSGPFTYGNIMRGLGKKGLYLKNTAVIKRINTTSAIVFDKTGTLTTGSSNHVEYHGNSLDKETIESIVLLANSSTHPLSKALVAHHREQFGRNQLAIELFEEKSGSGINGRVNGLNYKIGSPKFIGVTAHEDVNETAIYIAIDDTYVGRYVFESEFRQGIFDLLRSLQKAVSVHILSGDNDKDRVQFETNAPEIKELHFNQAPQDKLNYIEALQANGEHVMMVGDGLNDSGALDTADVGIAVSEDIFRFTPSSDAIIEAKKLVALDKLIASANRSKSILLVCYSFSVLYNVIGLGFAVTGNLTPLIAAILMPLSSITIVIISTLLSRINN